MTALDFFYSFYLDVEQKNPEIFQERTKYLEYMNISKYIDIYHKIYLYFKFLVYKF